jgi:hypothetical protein
MRRRLRFLVRVVKLLWLQEWLLCVAIELIERMDLADLRAAKDLAEGQINLRKADAEREAAVMASRLIRARQGELMVDRWL